MQELTRKRSLALGLRARAPLLARIMAGVLLAAGIGFVAHSYFKLRNNSKFKMFPATPELSKDVTGRIEGYEQRVTKNDRLYMLVKASVDVTFSDNHHELENVSVSLYPPVGDKPDQISALRAIYNPTTSLITFLGNVKIETKDALKVNTDSLSFDQNSDVAQTDAPINFERENVSGKSLGAVVEQKTKKLELKKDVEVTVAPRPADVATKDSLRSRPVTIKAAHGTFEQETLRLSFSGGVTAEQELHIMSGDTLNAVLNSEKKLEKVEVRGNSYMRVMDPGRAAEMHATDMDFFLDKDQLLQRATATKDTVGRTLDADSDMQISGANTLDVLFQAQDQRSLLKEMDAGGRSVVSLSAPKSRANDPRAASKRLTADAVKLSWRSSGRDLEKAEAEGNAELYVEPVQKTAKADRKTLTAPRFDCDFYESGNIARNCTATGGAKAILDPFQPSEKHGTRTMTAQKMTASFVRETQDIEKVDATGEAKFNELDRNGVANTITYTAADETVRLRGGDPTVWDSRARTKAVEIDSNNATHVSVCRSKVQTTYYSQEQTNGAAPFKKVKSPVYLSGDRADID